MSYLLHIDASSLSEASVSRQVARSFRDEWKGAVVHRDLAVSPAPHLSAAGITARTTDPAEHTPEQAKALAVQDELIEEFLGADAPCRCTTSRCRPCSRRGWTRSWSPGAP